MPNGNSEIVRSGLGRSTGKLCVSRPYRRWDGGTVSTAVVRWSRFLSKYAYSAERVDLDYRPPVTSRIAPVTYEASSESSHRIATATSSGFPPRFMGTRALSRSTRSGSPPLACRSVWISPGRTPLTRIPSSATSFASPTVNVSTAPLLAA